MLIFNCETRKWQEAEIQELSAEAKRPLTMEE